MSRAEIDQVLARTDLAALLTRLSGRPQGHGHRARWCCPAADHDDEHPSVTMFVDRHGIERWRCWSGGHNGTAIDAVMLAQQVGFTDAVRVLDANALPEPVHRRPAEIPQAHGHSYALRQWVATAEVRLWTRDGAGALDHLRERTISDDVIRANRCGAHPERHQRNGIPTHAGVTLAWFDTDGELSYAQSRNLSATALTKYSNPTARHCTPPHVAYLRGGPTTGRLLVTEGVLDGLAAISAGERAIAVRSASDISRHTAVHVARHAGNERIVIAFDADPAGNTAARRLAELLRTITEVPVSRLVIPAGHDLTSARQAGLLEPHIASNKTTVRSRSNDSRSSTAVRHLAPVQDTETHPGWSR